MQSIKRTPLILTAAVNLAYNEDDEGGFQLEFVLNRSVAYVYDEKISPMSLIGSELEEAKILSGAAVNGFALFFSKNNGVISETPSDFDFAEINYSSVSPKVLSIGIPLAELSFSTQAVNYTTLYDVRLQPDYNLAEITSTSNDMFNQIKATFMYQGNTTACKEIIDALVQEYFIEDQNDGVLDRAIVTIAKDIAGDMPAADPR